MDRLIGYLVGLSLAYVVGLFGCLVGWLFGCFRPGLVPDGQKTARGGVLGTSWGDPGGILGGSWGDPEGILGGSWGKTHVGNHPAGSGGTSSPRLPYTIS